jgi:hypothetical protein
VNSPPAVFWAYARLARRITLARVTEALCDVAGAAVAPLLAPLAIEISNDICVTASSVSSSEKTGFTPTERAATARGDGAVAASMAATAAVAAVIVPPKPKRKRVTFETETETAAVSIVDAEMALVVASSDEEDIKHVKKSTNPLLTATTDVTAAAITSPLALALTTLKGLERLWSPNVAHTRIAPFAPYPYVPTTPHGLLCAAGGALRALASADAGADETSSVFFRKSSSSASGSGSGASGIASARERSSGATRALCAILAVPETQTSPSSSAAVAGLSLFATTYAVPLTRALVRALRNDIGWKPLHHALLSLARHERAGARLGAISSLAALHDEAGADALTLLPEALPVLAETAHDADARVEAATHALVDALQTASGEDLGSFLV